MAVNVLKNSNLYDVIVKKLFTDKVYKNSQNNSNFYAFEVNVKYQKNDVKNAIEGIFGVKVGRVNILNRYSLSRSFRGKRSQFNTKIAYVYLVSGSIGDEF